VSVRFCRKRADVSLCPLCAIRDLTRRSKKHRYSITLSGAQQQVGGNFMADDFRGLQIDDQLELGWRFDREIGRLCTAQPKQDSCAIRSADAHLV
jgi:hypothetical protein